MKTVPELVFEMIEEIKLASTIDEERGDPFFSEGYFAFMDVKGDYVGYSSLDELDSVTVTRGTRIDLNDKHGPYFYFRLDGDVSYSKLSSSGSCKNHLSRTIPLKLVFIAPKVDRFALELFVYTYFSQKPDAHMSKVMLEPYEVYVEELLYGKGEEPKKLNNITLVSFNIDYMTKLTGNRDCKITLCSNC